MKKNFIETEIPFGVKDSELYQFIYTIPDGYSAEIKDRKVIIKKQESEDERIRNEIIEIVRTSPIPENHNELLAYLERQKEQKPESCDCSRDEESYTNGIHHVLMNPEAYGLIKQQPTEWSEEEKEKIDDIIGIICDARECSKIANIGEEKEDNSAFYNKLVLFLKSLRPSWKPSAQEKWALRTAIHVFIKERNLPKAAAQLQNILDTFEGKESRKDWKPSEEQMDALYDVLHPCDPVDKEKLESLYNDLKKLI